jgi:2-dehydropantoate 2-reductase
LVRSSGVGEVTLTAHPRLDDLAKILRAANLDVRVVKNVQPFVWGKLVVNAAINPLTAILHMKNGELLGNPPAYKLMREIAHEAASVGKALGVELPFLVPEDAVEDVAKHTADNISSMLQDVLRGAQTEVDAINGAIIRKGKQKGVLTPANRVVWLLVKALPRLGKI